MRTIGVVTVGRSDYGIYRPVLRRIAADPELELLLIVSGSHLEEEHGSTVTEIEADGFGIAERVELELGDDSAAGVAASMARGVEGFGAVYARRPIDILLVLGDRAEMLAAVVAAVPFAIPIAHIHGGEATEGAIDDAIRHAITKLSHLHFASTDAYGRRIEQMGEEPWRVTVTGAPALDDVDLEGGDPVDVDEPFVLVTWHPVTLEQSSGEEQLEELLAALVDVDAQLVFTHPNADTGRRAIVSRIERFASDRGNSRIFVSLGTRAYFDLLRRAKALVGNSSSGIIEAASFELPVVNVGSRQRGRVRGANVIDVECERAAIAGALRRATSQEFRDGLRGLENPYGDGHAAERIVERLRNAPLGRELIVKHFHEAA